MTAATIAVSPERLRQAAAATRALGARLADLRGQLAAATGGLDAAAGGPGARAAVADLLIHWAAVGEGLAAEVAALAAALEAAADDYERADRDGLPAGSGAPGRAAPLTEGAGSPAGAGHHPPAGGSPGSGAGQ